MHNGLLVRFVISDTRNFFAIRKKMRLLKPFVEGFIKGVKETPRAFFAPAVAIWRLLLDTTESLCESASVKTSKTKGGRQ